MVPAVYFDDLDATQRLTLLTFALLSQKDHLPGRKEAIAEGIFDHIVAMFEAGECGSPPFLVHEHHKEMRTIEGILDEVGNTVPILPHESEISPWVLIPGLTLCSPQQDQNPYKILTTKVYGEEGERLAILAKIGPEEAEVFGTEPMMVLLDLHLHGEEAPTLHEMPLDLGICLASMLAEFHRVRAYVN